MEEGVRAIVILFLFFGVALAALILAAIRNVNQKIEELKEQEWKARMTRELKEFYDTPRPK